MKETINKSQRIFLTFLALPLSFVGIPIYLNISDFYARKFDLNLAIIGLLLIFVRIFDALQDPAIGYFSDKLAQKKITHKKIIIYSSLLLAVSFYLVFNPPFFLNQSAAILWFGATLLFTYTCFNFAVINFESLVAMSAHNDFERITLNSTKEFLGLIGMIFAFLLPTVFAKLNLNNEKNYLALSLVFAGFLIFALVLLTKNKIDSTPHFSGQKLKLSEVFRDKKFRIFLTIFFINSIAVSLPAANLVFYVTDILQQEQNLGYFLAIYFLSAALCISLWKYLAKRHGIIKIWIITISGSIVTFYFAYLIDKESANYFYLICFFSGAFLGADLIAPPAILSRITQDKKEFISSYFSLWNMVTKFGLMIAASVSLITLGLAGYKPSDSMREGLMMIPFFYAELPCMINIIVAWSLIKIDQKKIYET